MQLKMSFPERKISESFLEFAEPLLEFDDKPPTQDEVEKCLQLASTVWNAVVFDTVRGNTKFITQVRQLMAGHPPMTELVEAMILRKQRWVRSRPAAGWRL